MVYILTVLRDKSFDTTMDINIWAESKRGVLFKSSSTLASPGLLPHPPLLGFQMWWICHTVGWNAETVSSCRRWEEDSKYFIENGYPAKARPDTAAGGLRVWPWAVQTQQRQTWKEQDRQP